jgi:uncharacterized repeat protein (TIGR01451 family)
LWDNVQAGPTAQRSYDFGADLKVSKTTDQTTAHLGQPVTYTVIVTNQGPSLAQGVTLTDTFSKNAGFGAVTPTRGNWRCTVKATKSQITCTLTSLAVDDYAALTIVLKPTAKGTLSNTASATEQSPGDTDTTNNTTSVNVPVRP